ESRSASFSGNLFWEGSPAAFSFVGSSGRVEVDIDNGRFVDIDSGSSRLLGAFSFDAIVRRLQLDFSDLFGRGLTFDNIDGGLMFDQGTVSTDERIVIEGPSSRISLTGQIDLALETIQADMLVTLPLSQNITVLAGILGAWPLAVSTYVACKIFQDQVDDFATVVYRLEGPWANPEAGFEPPDDEVEPEPPQQE
ncbi:MAG: AsmA-like C-terminal region-containing protein, partial [Pseudohongiellaceae bacterium]